MPFDPTQPQQLVRQISNPGVYGVTTGRNRRAGTTFYVQIEIGPNERKFVPADDLEPLLAVGNSIEDLLRQLRFGKKGDLARILTYHKISSNLSNIFYAMQTSRTDFYAYQFKPVYKFIESLNGRLLIADEVGLGKTIEAGLIWLETRARRPDAKRLLVVCPSMLREKWKQELRSRFDTKAEIYDAQGFITLLEDFRREGVNFSCAAVCSLQSIRQDRIKEALETLENTLFDLVIIDEAHHLRNPETKSHKVGKSLSDVAEAMVLLTATPIHLGNQDLYHLLRLLDADEYSERWSFDVQIRENAPLIRAQDLLRVHPPEIEQAREKVALLQHSPWFNQAAVQMTLDKLAGLESDNRRELIGVGRLLETLNLLGATISRTRKREVQENRVMRQATALAVQFNQREADFYNAVTETVQNRVSNWAGNTNTVAAFALMMPQRQMASCIPAMVEHYRRNAATAFDEETLEEMGLLSDEAETPETGGLWLEIQHLIDDWEANTPDSKFAELLRALRDRFEREPDAKIIVFSYFKKTLEYLRHRLALEGFAPVMIHGGVPMEERLEAIDTFRDNPRRRVLLSSEVGSEGIDLQFCRIVINYDLPWNPMKVEQRIGRVDRLGQKADVITIINFAVAGTIEDKILRCLYERIGIFESSLGDLEPILGELTQNLTRGLLSRRLTDAQIKARIEQTALALETKRQQEEQLIEQSALFLGSSDYILEQIEGARNSGRWITPKDLRSFIEDFFGAAYAGTQITWNSPQEGLVSLRLSNEARNELHQFCLAQHPPLTTALMHTGGTHTLAFRAEVAQQHPRYEMLTHFHPLVKWMCAVHQGNQNAFFPVAAIELKTASVPSGQYLIVAQRWKFEGQRKKFQIVYEMASLNGTQEPVAGETEKLVQEMLEHGTSWEYADRMVDPTALISAWEECTNRLGEEYEAAYNDFAQENEILYDRHKTHVTSHFQRKIAQKQQSIQTMLENREPEYRIKQFRGWLEKEQNRQQETLAKIEAARRTGKDFDDIAAIVCRIEN